MLTTKTWGILKKIPGTVKYHGPMAPFAFDPVEMKKGDSNL